MCVVLPFCLFVCLLISLFVVFLDKTQRGSGSQESALERRLEPRAVVGVFGVRLSMVVLVLCVLCLPLPLLTSVVVSCDALCVKVWVDHVS